MSNLFVLANACAGLSPEEWRALERDYHRDRRRDQIPSGFRRNGYGLIKRRHNVLRDRKETDMETELLTGTYVRVGGVIPLGVEDVRNESDILGRIAVDWRNGFRVERIEHARQTREQVMAGLRQLPREEQLQVLAIFGGEE